MLVDIFSPYTLRSGLVLKNRIAKAAMEEGLAAKGQLPDERMFSLYRRWGQGGAGMLITGNVMVQADALTGSGNIILDANTPLDPFKKWAKIARAQGSAILMQINHPGRQMPVSISATAMAPSAIAVKVGKHSRQFGHPRAMTAEQIRETVQHFAVTAQRAYEAGFDGVEVHAAHGYLLSQFLSPLSNERTDEWGGSLENRAKIVVDIVSAIRRLVPDSFTVAVKLNSADFQRGGFDMGDAQRVIEMLAPLGVDFVELSGGSYENPTMMGKSVDARTQAREAYFLDFAEKLVHTSPLPLMLTGGITQRATAQRVLDSGVAIVGIGTALSVYPDLPHRWAADEPTRKHLKPVNWSDKLLASVASMALVRYQMRRMAHDRTPTTRVHPVFALLCDWLVQRRSLRNYRLWMRKRSR